MGEQNKQVQLKNFNRRSVLGYIRKNGAAPKAGLAAATGLTFMAIKKILEELEELGLIRCDAMEKGSVGRHALTYVINEDYKYTIGVHINKYATKVALLDLRGHILRIERYDMERSFQNQSGFVDAIVSLTDKVITEEGINKDDILGIGVGAPGPIDMENGVILTPPNMPFLNYLPLREVMEERTGCRVYLYKDTNAIAFGEYWDGEGKQWSDLIYIDVDMGIGSGLIIDGKIKVGANSIAGEFGHITIDLNGPVCNCGNRGCLEAMSSGIAVLKELSRQLDEEEDHPLYAKRKELVIEDVFEMVRKNDLLTISILNQSAHYMGIAISNVINILDPQVIIFGGILIQNYPRYFQIAQTEANSKKVKGARENVMRISALGENAGVIGAGEIVADEFFNRTVNEVFLKNGGIQE